MDPLLLQLRRALSTGPVPFVDRWMEETARRCWRLQRSPELTEELRGRSEVFLRALAEAVGESSTLRAGDPDYREPLKLLSFVAGWLVGVDLPIGAGLALCHGFQAALGDLTHPFLQNLEVAVAESYAAGQRERAQVRHRQVIKKSQLVCMLSEQTAALMLVGDPEREALEDAVGRLMMLALMRVARYLLVDVSTVANLDSALPKVFQLLAGHREGLGEREVSLLLTGLADADAQRLLPASLPLGCQRFETVEQGLSSLQSK